MILSPSALPEIDGRKKTKSPNLMPLTIQKQKNPCRSGNWTTRPYKERSMRKQRPAHTEERKRSVTMHANNLKQFVDVDCPKTTRPEFGPPAQFAEAMRQTVTHARRTSPFGAGALTVHAVLGVPMLVELLDRRWRSDGERRFWHTDDDWHRGNAHSPRAKDGWVPNRRLPSHWHPETRV